MGKYFFLFLLQIICCSGAIAQEQTEVYDTLIEKTEGVTDNEDGSNTEEINSTFYPDTFVYAHPIDVSQDSIAAISANKKFAYVKNLDSLLKAYQQNRDQKRTKPIAPSSPSFMDRMLGGSIFKGILWAIALLFTGIIVYQLLKGNGLFQKQSTAKMVSGHEPEEELIEYNDFDALIQKAVAQNDYRSAVRYHFIKALQQLRDKNHIQYQADKTNSRYVYEMPQHLRNEFSRLTIQYEYVWYGHFDITARQYENVRNAFNVFYPKI